MYTEVENKDKLINISTFVCQINVYTGITMIKD